MWEEDFQTLLQLAKSFILEVWELRKQKLYGSQPSGVRSQSSAESLDSTLNCKGKSKGKFKGKSKGKSGVASGSNYRSTYNDASLGGRNNISTRVDVNVCLLSSSVRKSRCEADGLRTTAAY